MDRLGGGSYASVYAIWNEVFAIGMATGPLAGGLLRHAFSVRWTLVIAAIPLAVYAVILAAAGSPRALANVGAVADRGGAHS